MTRGTQVPMALVTHNSHEEAGMEIAQYLRGPWLAALILVPLITGAAAAVVVEPTPGYEARGVFTFVPPTNNELSTDTVDPYVDDFRSTLESKVLLNQIDSVLAPYGASLVQEPAVAAGGNGTDIDVWLVTDDPAASEESVRHAATYALARIAGKELGRVQLELSAAEGALDATNSALTIFESERGVQDDSNEFARRSGDILNLKNSLANATTEAQRGQLQALLDEKQLELAIYAGSLSEWRLLDAQLSAAIVDQSNAASRYSLVSLWSTETTLGEPFDTIEIKQLSTVTDRMLLAAPAIAGSALLIFLAAWLAGRSTSDRTRRGPAVAVPPQMALAPRPQAQGKGQVPARTYATTPVSVPPPQAAPSPEPSVRPSQPSVAQLVEHIENAIQPRNGSADS